MAKNPQSPDPRKPERTPAQDKPSGGGGKNRRAGDTRKEEDRKRPSTRYKGYGAT